MDGNIVLRIATALPGFLFGIVLHEFAHAWVAKKFGDDTAERQGRLSMNPAVHYDPIGTVVFPLIGAAIGGVMFGWAKPVPIDPRRFKDIKKGIFWVSFAGPLANILLAIVCAMAFAILATRVSGSFAFHSTILQMLRSAILINIVLAVFNLIPFPPLDGSKMVSTFMDYNTARRYEDLQKYSFVFILILWFTPLFSYMIQPALKMGMGITNIFINLFG